MCVRPARLNSQKEIGLTVPCGQCIECRLKRSREWAIRCMHEASLFSEGSSFITLTYADEFLPKGGSLDRRAFPLFMKRLRKEVGPVRYFHVGEYGEQNGRPHYHALLFGLRFADERPMGVTGSGYPAFVSDQLSGLWTAGASQIGEVTFESAQYVARYCVKKITGSRAEAHYQRLDAKGCKYVLEPEYATMSRRPGIGSRWLEENRADVERDDSVISRGHEVTPPRFYDKKLSDAQQEVMKARRLRKRGERVGKDPGVTWRTNAARELIAVAALKQLEEARR